MAQIISGVTPEEVNFAYLAGQDRGTKLVQDRDKLELAQRKVEADQMAEIRRATAEYHKEQAKSQALLNRQAQMGNAQALQELALRVKAGQENPDQQMVESMMGIMSGIQDEGARALAAKSFESVLKEREAQKQSAAFEQQVERAGNDGYADPEAYKQRRDAGEDPAALSKELAGIEQKRTLESMATQKATAALEQATALVQAAPEGSEKLAAEFLLTQYANSPTDQAKPGSDADLIFKVQKALLGSNAAYKAREKERYEQVEARAHSIPRGTSESMEKSMQTPGAVGRATMPLRLHSEKKPYEKPPGVERDAKRAKAEKEKRFSKLPARSAPPVSKTGKKATIPDAGQAAVELVEKAKDERDLLRLMRERGIPITAENMQKARAALQQWSDSVESQAGATR